MAAETHTILVASYTSSIYTLRFTPSAETLELVGETEVGFHPSWITAIPSPSPTSTSSAPASSGESENATRLIAGVLEQPSGQAFVASVSPTGAVEVLGKAGTGGHSPCHIVEVDGQLLVANYMSGSIASLPLLPAPPYFDSSTPPRVIALEGRTGPNEGRQEGPHAHEVSRALYSSNSSTNADDEQELLVPDLGGDRVYRLRRTPSTSNNEKGAWEIHSHITYPPGHGPRHVASHAGVLYALQELIPGVAASRLPLPSSQSLTVETKDVVSTLGKELGEEDRRGVIAAEILIPPPNARYGEAYVYATNRNLPGPGGDTITVLSTLSPSSTTSSTTSTSDAPQIKLLAEIPTGLAHLRGIAFGGAHNEWLIAGGAQGGGVKVFERVDRGRGLKEVARYQDKEMCPTGFLWL